jgi:hypothetical protein
MLLSLRIFFLWKTRMLYACKFLKKLYLVQVVCFGPTKTTLVSDGGQQYIAFCSANIIVWISSQLPTIGKSSTAVICCCKLLQALSIMLIHHHCSALLWLSDRNAFHSAMLWSYLWFAHNSDLNGGLLPFYTGVLLWGWLMRAWEWMWWPCSSPFCFFPLDRLFLFLSTGSLSKELVAKQNFTR